MKKAYFTALLVVLITGSFFGSACSYLRAGRDKIMMGRNRATNQLHIQPAECEQEKPVYYRRKSYGQVKPLGNEQGTLCSLNAYHIGGVYTAPERLGNERSHSENASIVHSPHYAEEISKCNNHRSFWFCLFKSKTCARISHHYREVTIFQKLRFQIARFSVHSKTQSRRL